MVDELTSCQARLAGQGGEWGLHRLDTAVFSYYVLRWGQNLDISREEWRVGYSNRVNGIISYLNFRSDNCLQ